MTWMDESFREAGPGWRVVWVDGAEVRYEPIAGWVTQRSESGVRRFVAARVVYPATIEVIEPDDGLSHVLHPSEPDLDEDAVAEAVALHRERGSL